MPKNVNVLFVTWDGPRSSYLEGLFLPIFRDLKENGINFHVVQFTWAEKFERDSLHDILEACGVTYQAIPIWRRQRSLGSLLALFFGAYHIGRAIKKLNINIVMPRSTLPAIASLYALKKNVDVRLLFDADGLPHDERVEFGGMSSDSLVYRLLRDFEALAVRRADAVLTRSKKAIDILAARGGSGVTLSKFHVVTNGRDQDLFKPFSLDCRLAIRRALKVPSDAPLVVYVGSSMHGKYCGLEMLEFFKCVKTRRADAHLLILSPELEEACILLSQHSSLRSSCHIMHVAPVRVAEYLSVSDLGLAFIQPTFSMQAVAAIKLGEYLLCGLPVLATAGIGDTDVISADVGMVFQRMDEATLMAAADWFVDSVLPHRERFRASSRSLGLARFALGASAASYRDALRDLVRQP